MKPRQLQKHESQAARLRTVQMISRLLAATNPLDLGQKLTSQLRELTGAETILLLAHRGDGGGHELLHVCPARQSRLFSADELQSFCPEQAPDPMPRRTEDLPSGHPMRALLSRAGVQNLLSFPLRAGGELLGVLVLLNLQSMVLTDLIVDTMNLLSPSIALALKNARAFRQIERQRHEIESHALELERRVEERTADLAKSHSLLVEAQAVAHLGSWQWDVATDIITGSDEFYRLFGVEPGQLADYLQFNSLLHSEDRERVQQNVKDVLKQDRPYDTDYRIPLPGGEIRHINAKARVFYDEEGKPSRMVGTCFDITERKEAEQALRKSEQLYRAIGESIDYGVWVCTPDGQNTYASESFLKLVGITQDQCSNFGWGNVLHPGDAERTIAAWKECVRTAAMWNIEHRFRGVDGKWHPVLARGVPVRDEQGLITCWAGINLDISQIKRAEEALYASEERFRRAVMDSPFPILLHAEDGTIIQASNSWCEITGYSREELATIADWTERAYGEKRALVQVDIDRLYSLDHRVAEGDYTIRTQSGGTRIWDFSSAPLGRLPDGRRMVISMAMDVTERRAVEDEVRRLNAELEQRVQDRTAQLELVNSELEAFSYSVSHDLRAPVRAIDGFAGILSEEHAERLDQEGRRLLGVIKSESGRMGKLIDDLLNFSRIGRTPMKLEEIDMTALAQDVWEEQAHLHPERRPAVNMTPLPPARGDRAMIRLVWSNLISNALKFTKYQPNTIIEIGAITENAETTHYYIRDNGAGFNMKYVHKLFGVFQRLHDSSSFEGTGVGLALAQRIIHRHGGSIRAEGKVDAGATFYFSLTQEPCKSC